MSQASTPKNFPMPCFLECECSGITNPGFGHGWGGYAHTQAHPQPLDTLPPDIQYLSQNLFLCKCPDITKPFLIGVWWVLIYIHNHTPNHFLLISNALPTRFLIQVQTSSPTYFFIRWMMVGTRFGNTWMTGGWYIHTHTPTI